jgi:two-component system, OmpR family, phosphate regulon response regulator PhoB
MRERVVICEDEAALAELMAVHLGEAGYDTVVVGTGAAALELVQRERPALLVLDVVLPDVSGMQVLRCLRDARPTRDLPVIVVTARVDEIDRVVGFELGADDYMSKPFSFRELVLRVKAVLRRSTRPANGDEERTLLGPLTIDRSRHEVRVDGKRIGLTALEFRLLLDMVEHRGAVIRRDELLERVWRYPGDMDTRTVDTLVKRLRSKLGEAGWWIETVRGVGYRLRAR